MTDGSYRSVIHHQKLLEDEASKYKFEGIVPKKNLNIFLSNRKNQKMSNLIPSTLLSSFIEGSNPMRKRKLKIQTGEYFIKPGTLSKSNIRSGLARSEIKTSRTYKQLGRIFSAKSQLTNFSFNSIKIIEKSPRSGFYSSKNSKNSAIHKKNRARIFRSRLEPRSIKISGNSASKISYNEKSQESRKSLYLKRKRVRKALPNNRKKNLEQHELMKVLLCRGITPKRNKNI